MTLKLCRVFVLAVCLLLPCFQAAAEGKHLFILSGQSNMRQPLPDTFRRCVEQVFGKDRVIVVTNAWPSQPIKNWYRQWTPPTGMKDEKPENNGTLYDRLLQSVQKAIKGQAIETVTFIWMQGEADAGNGWGSVYEKSFLGVLDQFKQDLKIENINFVVGRINEYWLEKQDGELMRSVLQKLGDDHANGGWINTDDLNRGVNPWGGYSFEDGHYPPPGYRVMGQRFAKKACKLIDPEIDVGHDVFKEVFFDAADQIKTHAAVGKTVQGDGLHALVDGKLGPLDHNDPAWIGIGPLDEPHAFVLDLGEVVSVETIAVSMLISSQASAEFPDKLVYSTSIDGETYAVNGSRYNNISFYNKKKLNQMRSQGIKPQAVLLLTEQRQGREKTPAQARYIKIEIQTGKQRVYLDEIIVNPQASDGANGHSGAAGS